jgi:hypothetical protein
LAKTTTLGSSVPLREWTCNPEVTPFEYLAATEIKAANVTKRNPKLNIPAQAEFGS